MKKIIIKEALESDFNQVLDVEREAFASEEEPKLVQDLLEDESASPCVSLLALDGEKAVGHILLTKASIESNPDLKVSILAPLAVIPTYQKQGIGKKLIQQGLHHLLELGIDLVFVLGYPQYYQPHGFLPAGKLGFEAPYPILEKNADAWMVQELKPGIIGALKGRVICADQMNKPEYWQE